MVPRHRRRPREGRRRQAQVLRDPLAVERRLQPHRADEGAAARTGDAGRVNNSFKKLEFRAEQLPRELQTEIGVEAQERRERSSGGFGRGRLLERPRVELVHVLDAAEHV